MRYRGEVIGSIRSSISLRQSLELISLDCIIGQISTVEQLRARIEEHRREVIAWRDGPRVPLVSRRVGNRFRH